MEIPQIKDYPVLKKYIEQRKDPKVLKIIETIFLCGQGKNIFSHLNRIPDSIEKLDALIASLLPVEDFYNVLGGLKAYHSEFLWLLNEKTTKKPQCQYLLPQPIDITHMTPEVHRAIRTSIENCEKLAEIYPIGGSGDRFALKDPKTGEDLPLASLVFRGYSLIEGLIRDLQAKEYLCFKLKGTQVSTPIAMMTSHEKRNHERILEIMEKNHWFGRNAELFKIFVQPLVPVISEDGTWVQSEPLVLCMKPGGHGVLWKIAHDAGMFEWLANKQTSKALVRQINNPIAGVDYGLLAFTGFGIEKNKSFGFASCQRAVNSAEGMNVLIENIYPGSKSYDYCLSNIEYTNLEQEGMKDTPVSPGSPYSAYPCNTNILFVDLPIIDTLCLKFPLPGMLINLKHKHATLQPDGSFIELRAGRIETTMQNISDHLLYSIDRPLEDQTRLPQYITYNERIKTISVTKQQHCTGEKIDNTPEGALRDFHTLYRRLLTEYCQFSLPEEETLEEFLTTGPSFYFDHHPALGPLYAIIGFKLRQSTLQKHSELILDIAEVDISQITLQGSLKVKASIPCGHHNENEKLRYSHHGGKCTLRNVKISNKGMDRATTTNYWQGNPVHTECCSILIEGNGEFYAENVAFTGTKTFFVPNGHRLSVTTTGEALEKINEPTWHWEYYFGENDEIRLVKKTR